MDMREHGIQLNMENKKSQNKILVIGDSCKDIYIYGSCDRLCPDAPVPVLIPTKKVENLGMAGNVYENVKSLGGNVDFLTNSEDITKTRYVDEKNNHMFVRVDSDKNKVGPIERLNKVPFDDYEAVIVSDYCKGFLTTQDIEFICDSHPRVFIDTKKHLGSFCENAFIIKINELEYNTTKYTLDHMEGMEDKLIITLGGKGCYYNDKNYPVENVDVKDMTGAGDTFISSLCVKYIETYDLDEAIEFANECATKVVQMRGVNTV